MVSIIRDIDEGTIEIEYETKDETAFAGQDYAYTSGTVNFGPGEARKDVEIEILDDQRTDRDATFLVCLVSDSMVSDTVVSR